MMATYMPTLKMKLLIETKKNRVLFAEADKDVVDFLFSLLGLPVATIVKMLGKESMCGSVGNLYASVKDLDYDYIHPSADKRDLQWPMVDSTVAINSRSPILKVNYVDASRRNLEKASSSKGCVRAAVTYTVRDDLTVSPMSNISSIALFSILGVTDLGALQEKTVLIGYSEGLKIIKASLESKTVLTDVFLSKKRARVHFEA